MSDDGYEYEADDENSKKNINIKYGGNMDVNAILYNYCHREVRNLYIKFDEMFNNKKEELLKYFTIDVNDFKKEIIENVFDTIKPLINITNIVMDTISDKIDVISGLCHTNDDKMNIIISRIDDIEEAIIVVSDNIDENYDLIKNQQSTIVLNLESINDRLIINNIKDPKNNDILQYFDAR